jgi:hypothetical protein
MTTEMERAAEIAGRKLTKAEENDQSLRKLADSDRPLWARVRDMKWGKPVLPNSN